MVQHFGINKKICNKIEDLQLIKTEEKKCKSTTTIEIITRKQCDTTRRKVFPEKTERNTNAFIQSIAEISGGI